MGLPDDHTLALRASTVPWRGRMYVRFSAEPIWIDVEGESMKGVWNRRKEIAAQVKPEAFYGLATSIEEGTPND